MKLWDKYLVLRRDNTVPEWPYLVMGAADPYVPDAIREYARLAEVGGEDEEYVQSLLELADSFDEYRESHPIGDPASGPHRTDDSIVVNRIHSGSQMPGGWKMWE